MPTLDPDRAEKIYKKVTQEHSPGELAIYCNVAPNTVSNWRQRGVSLLQVHRVAKLTGLDPHYLRPDIYA